MGHGDNIGKYRCSRTIGEGSFAKVKLAVDSSNCRPVAIKIIDKDKIQGDDYMRCQVQSEIKTMKLLNHPNIIRIHEVIGTKSKIYIVMEYASGGQLSDKLAYAKKFSEWEARKLFQQLIDAVDYCHARGVYHRDLKPENLLLDGRGNLKISDFGLSALRKPGDLLSTACGSPCYVAPELLVKKSYNGAAADTWSCGVILYELLAGFLPFDDRNLINLYKKIYKADYMCPPWFTRGQRRMLTKILEPSPKKRITITEIIEDEWFQVDYEPAIVYDSHEKIYVDDVTAAFQSTEEKGDIGMKKSSSFINAFQLIAMSHDLNLSGLFEEEDEHTEKTMLVSKLAFGETMKMVEDAATETTLLVERVYNKMKIHPKMTRCPRSYCNLSAEVIELAPTHCVIELSRSSGKLGEYREFFQRLSYLLTENSGATAQTDVFDLLKCNSSIVEDFRCPVEELTAKSIDLRGYSSS
ncbi:hypothetical protein MLD38_007211 [Melastoma candidum]|uniref:Uncharacterized protein n=1 Tax=Melastoma candidum TaxID=119954 RepID=A0ACB9RQ20_9MYRT|nr:hypothetical protein MLD38_007211 [Melastoma candidum]